jgi:hypothetical protein
MMCKMQIVAGLIGCLVGVLPANAQTPPSTPGEVGCLVCHKGIEPIREAALKMLDDIREEIPDGGLAVSLLHHVAEYSGQLPKTAEQHTSLIHKVLLTTAWSQAAAMFGLPLAMAVGVVWYVQRRRKMSRRIPQ